MNLPAIALLALSLVLAQFAYAETPADSGKAANPTEQTRPDPCVPPKRDTKKEPDRKSTVPAKKPAAAKPR